MRVFYDVNIKSGAKEHVLSKEESKHICKVLRLEIGNKIALVNGKGYYFEAEILDNSPKACRIKIEQEKFKPSSEKEVHIAIAPPKTNDRMEWFLEKATEIGVTAITPLLCSNSERKKIKLERYERILISAMKQSRRYYLPKLQELTPFQEFLQVHPRGLIATCYDEKKSSISETLRSKSCPILIGPEGDFTKEETQKAHDSGYISISLGENRLRTETAGLVACMEAVKTGIE